MADSPVVSSELGDLGAITRLTATGGTCIGWVWRAAVTCAGDLLGEAERRLLARLSVLRGGFDLEVAERVAGGEPLAPQAVAGLLASLAGKSLVQVQADPVAHYWLLETVRQFAAGRLAASGEDTAVHASLLEWALDEAWSAEPARPGAERAGWSGRLSAGQASIRAALSWALGGAEPEAGRAEVMLANAAFLAGDLAEQDRHGRLAIELARTAAGREGLALALSAWSMCSIAGLSIQPATVAALDEAANLTAAYPDRFTEMVMRHLRARLSATLGELDAAETEVGLCWAAGQDAVRGVEVLASLAEARLAAAWDDIAAAVGALRRSSGLAAARPRGVRSPRAESQPHVRLASEERGPAACRSGAPCRSGVHGGSASPAGLPGPVDLGL